MLGILLIYFIGRPFYQLAEKFGKSKWGFAILGVGVYYAGTFIGGLTIGIIAALAGSTALEEMHNLVLSLIVLPFGILMSFILYRILKSNWEKGPKFTEAEILDEQLLERE